MLIIQHLVHNKSSINNHIIDYNKKEMDTVQKEDRGRALNTFQDWMVHGKASQKKR